MNFIIVAAIFQNANFEQESAVSLLTLMITEDYCLEWWFYICILYYVYLLRNYWLGANWILP